MHATIKIDTTDFNEKVSLFNKKARELAELAHELETYSFDDCLTFSSTESDEVK